MKIHADKIEAPPPHRLSIRQVREILAALPSEWTRDLKEVHLSNSLEYYSYAYFSRYDATLTIYSRRGTPPRILTAVLTALAQNILGINRGHHRCISHADRKRINHLIQPFFKKLLPHITPAAPLTNISLQGFKEITFPLVPNVPNPIS